jgi:hypothetical protein
MAAEKMAAVSQTGQFYSTTNFFWKLKLVLSDFSLNKGVP